jgi:hypothetical protein
MAKVAVSLTLGEENLVWLKGRAVRNGESLSGVLDALVSQVRTGRLESPAAPRSVVGTIDLPEADPRLDGADDAIRELFRASLTRPLMAREAPPQYGTRGPRRKARRG